MFLLALLAVFVVVPVVELLVAIQVAHVIGWFGTLGLMLLVSVVGFFLLRWAGLGAFRRFRADVDAGRLPGESVVDGLLILVGGVLMVLPGFVTGAVGLLLILPPIRAVVRHLVLRRVRNRIDSTLVIVGGSGPAAAGFARRWRRGDDGDEVLDVEGWEVPARGRDQLPSGPPTPSTGHA
jgi:UPF0716 protein FxsA